jgi:hypothetical protein
MGGEQAPLFCLRNQEFGRRREIDVDRARTVFLFLFFRAAGGGEENEAQTTKKNPF